MEEYVCGEREVCVYIMNNGSGVVFSLGGGLFLERECCSRRGRGGVGWSAWWTECMWGSECGGS